MTTSSLASIRSLRWGVPVAVAAGVVAVGTLRPVTADASPQLPERSAQQLLVALAAAAQHPVSGTVRSTARLGLPQLPDLSGTSTSGGSARGSGMDATEWLTGTKTLRVWYSGQDKVRVSVPRRLAETTVVRNGADVWVWDSAERTVTHRTVPVRDRARATEDLPTPDALARQALAAVDPTTAVTVSRTVRVAGRPAYELVATPRQSGTLIGSVRLAVDATTSVPLRAQVYAKGATRPAYEAAYTKVSTSRPADRLFRFTVPKGARVTRPSATGFTSYAPLPTTVAPDASGRMPRGYAGYSSSVTFTADDGTVLPDGAVPGLAPSAPDGVRTVGTGWTAVAVTPASAASAGPSALLTGALLAAAKPVSGDWGSGRLLRTALASVLLTSDGRLLVGAVGPDLLYAAARTR